MTRDDIIKLAREVWGDDSGKPWSESALLHLERFADLVAAAERGRVIGIAKGMQEELEAKFEQTYMQGVIAGAAAEREACARVCEDNFSEGALNIAAAIRARGQA